MRATIIVDASWCPDYHVGGWAAWMRIDNKLHKIQGAFKKNPKGSGQAEIWAAINAIVVCYRRGGRDILLQSDNMEVVCCANGKRHDDHFIKHVLSLAELKLKGKHVKGHSGIDDRRSWCNEWCHNHAYRIMRNKRHAARKTGKRKKSVLL